MAYRPTWQGHLKLSLVTCPVALYTATSAASGGHFHLINPQTTNRIEMTTTDPETGPIEDKAKGHMSSEVAEPDDTNVVDLTALRANLAGKGNADPPPAPRAKAKKRKTG